MNVEIGTEAPIFLFWEYLFQILGILSLQCSCLPLVIGTFLSIYLCDVSSLVNCLWDEIFLSITVFLSVPDQADDCPQGNEREPTQGLRTARSLTAGGQHAKHEQKKIISLLKGPMHEKSVAEFVTHKPVWVCTSKQKNNNYGLGLIFVILLAKILVSIWAYSSRLAKIFFFEMAKIMF